MGGTNHQKLVVYYCYTHIILIIGEYTTQQSLGITAIQERGFFMNQPGCNGLRFLWSALLLLLAIYVVAIYITQVQRWDFLQLAEVNFWMNF